jgi:CheY-like chemotaxis protein
LLAEDAVALRTLMRKVLEMKGYKVLEAADGRDAVQQARTFQGDISAFVTDMIMPHMGGLEAARQIRALHPGVKIIYMTGYADAAVFKPGSLSASEQLIEKPILPEELSLRLREMIEPEARRQTSR